MQWYEEWPEETAECPVLALIEFDEVFDSWRWWRERGSMPQGGGWANQSPVWVELMKVIEAAAPAKTGQ